MPQVILTPEAGNDITRFADFLIEHGAHEEPRNLVIIHVIRHRWELGYKI